MWIDGMGIAFVALIIEVTIVTTGGHRYVSDIQRSLQLMFHIQRILCWLRHTDTPRETLGIHTLSHNLTTDFNHKVFYTSLAQEIGHHIRTITFGNSRAVEHHARVLFLDLAIDE